MQDTAYKFENDLVNDIVNGNRSAENRLVEKYHAGLMGMLQTRCQDRQLVDDVLQESWLVIIRKLRAGDLKDPRRLSGFVTQVARNQLTMAFRKGRKLSDAATELEFDPHDPQADPIDKVENRQLGDSMAELLSNMSRKRDRELLLRFYHHGDSKAQLCEHLGLSSASFDAILARARNRFKKNWINNQ